MPAILLTWNPAKDRGFETGPTYDDLVNDVGWDQRRAVRFGRRRTTEIQWTVGNNGSVEVGTTVYLLLQGDQPSPLQRGILGSGRTSRAYGGGNDWGVAADFDVLLPFTDVLPIATLEQAVEGFPKRIQRSGFGLSPSVESAVADRWSEHLATLRKR